MVWVMVPLTVVATMDVASTVLVDAGLRGQTQADAVKFPGRVEVDIANSGSGSLSCRLELQSVQD